MHILHWVDFSRRIRKEYNGSVNVQELR